MRARSAATTPSPAGEETATGRRDAPSGTFKAVTAGGFHACAISSDDTIACWGARGHGRADPPSGTYKALDASKSHNCISRSDGTRFCFGAGHTCAIASDGTVACWGTNFHGQTDAPSGTYKAVAAGGIHTCAIRSDDTIACWGDTDSAEARELCEQTGRRPRATG